MTDKTIKPVPRKAAPPKKVAAKPAMAVTTAAHAPKAGSTPVPPAPTPKPIEAIAKTVKRAVEVRPPIAPVPVTEIIPLDAAPIAALTEGSKTMNDTVTKAQDTAKKLTADAGEKVQAMFGDASERAKGAYEKSVKMTEEFTEFQKGNVEAMVESGKRAAKAAESFGQEAADYARKSFESNTAAFKTFASAKSPTELFKLQSDYMKTAFEAAVSESTKVTEAWLKLAGEVAQPISNRMAVAVEKVKATASI